MFNDLINRLMGTAAASQEPETDYRVALCALLVRCARADDDYEAVEIETIDHVLRSRYDIGDEEAVALRKQGEALEGDANDTVSLTRAIKAGVPYEERRAVVVALWKVALSDGNREAEENALLRLVVKLLGVSDMDSALARQEAQKST